MTELIITRGYPGSGKSTWARKAADALEAIPGRRAVTLSRDNLRDNMFEQRRGLSHAQENQITEAHHAAVRALLVTGTSVIVDDTNLRERVIKAWMDIADEVGVGFSIQDFPVGAETCKIRNAQREQYLRVPDRVIDSMAQRFPHTRWRPEYAITIDRTMERNRALSAVSPDRYNGTPGRPKAFLVDIDGTLANMGGRNPFDWSRVHEDTPHEKIVDIVDRLWNPIVERERRISPIFVSGRSDECREATMAWLLEIFDVKQEWLNERLHMRKAGDGRGDEIVKREIFDEKIRHQYDVQFVLDDRDKVVRMWRAMGLTTLQVAEGDF